MFCEWIADGNSCVLVYFLGWNVVDQMEAGYLIYEVPDAASILQSKELYQHFGFWLVGAFC